MSWSVDFLRRWTPLIGFRAALQLRKAVKSESAGGPDREFEITLGGAIGTIYLRVPGTDGFTFHDVFANGIYDGALMRAGNCERIVDIGANAGFATLRFARLRPTSRILSVEPVPETFRQLERNTAGLRKAGRVQLLNCAIWGHETEVTVANPENRYATQSVMTQAGPGGEGTGIPALPMAMVFDSAGFDRVDLLKIDVEGAEVRVFRSDTGWLSRVRAVAIEFHGNSRQESAFDEVVTRAGFAVHDLGQGTIFAARNG